MATAPRANGAPMSARDMIEGAMTGDARQHLASIAAVEA